MSTPDAPRCVYQTYGEYDFAEPDVRDFGNGLAFRRVLSLPEGRHAWLVQWQVDATVLDLLKSVEMTIRDVATGARMAHLVLGGLDGPPSREALENIIMVTDGLVERDVEIIGSVVGGLEGVRLRHIKVIELAGRAPARELFFDERAHMPTRWVKSVFMGATNICNANCPHCPANKRMTAHLEQGRMSMEMFERIIRQLDGVEVGDCLIFGVFGEPFDDPLLEERVKLLRRLRPDIEIDIATNAGAVTLERVMDVIDHVRRISIHVEAAAPEIYNKLMTPLKATQVFPVIDQIIAAAPHRVTITTPLHRGNCHEAAALKRMWGRRGVPVWFSTLQTRATDLTAAKRNALAPTAGFWPPDLMDILVVDWDGMVLTTCDDFLRRQPLGDLKVESVTQVLDGVARRQAFDALREYRWRDMPSLYDAICDDPRAAQSYERAGIDDLPVFEFPAARFQHAQGVERGDGVIHIGGRPGNADPVIFGPYVQLPIGRYIARFNGTAAGIQDMALEFEAVSDFGRRRLASTRRSGSQLRNLDIAIEFHHDQPGDAIEFRVLPRAGEVGELFDFTGVTLTRVGQAFGVTPG